MRSHQLSDDSTLTEWEWYGLHRRYNLADGHAHHRLSQEQEAVLVTLPELFHDAHRANQSEIESDFATIFFALCRQVSRDHLSAPLFHYSSSVSIDVVAKALRALGCHKIGLPSPTFDNIPLLLRRQSLELASLDDDALFDRSNSATEALRGLDAVFLVTPNNPTGAEPTEEALREIARACAVARIPLILDCSFRFFGNFSRWDQYRTLLESGVDFAIIEDTGKTWPLAELKVGLLSATGSLGEACATISDEILLNVSPFVLRVLQRFMELDLEQRHRGQNSITMAVCQRNRQRLREHLEGSIFSVARPTSAISVEWIVLPGGWDSVEFSRWASGQGVAILPGLPFHWARPEAGRSFIRIALLREEQYFDDAVRQLVSLADQYRSVV